MNRYAALGVAALVGGLVAQANPGLLPWFGRATLWAVLVGLAVLLLGAAFLPILVAPVRFAGRLLRRETPPPAPSLEEQLAGIEALIAEGHPSRARMETLERKRAQLRNALG